MSYYETLDEDLKRAKEILAKGKRETDPQSPTYGMVEPGGIYGADIYAAYKLIESFVQFIEQQKTAMPWVRIMALEAEVAHLTKRREVLKARIDLLEAAMNPHDIPPSRAEGEE